ncbi:MAG: GvpL/GvpF family gas vesicle protein [Acidobacteria bacterium]|nr:GvpL/GvpF family gas vesicle protein [Acidobacteriota bacterium]
MKESQDATTATGVYLYCLARPTCLSVVTDLAEHGVGVDEGYGVSSLEHDGVVAVVGRVDPGEFHDENMQTLKWVGPRALRHEAVVEAIMVTSPVLPVKFGTIFSSLTSLESLLARHHDTISRTLEELCDKAEWSVKGYLEEEAARRHLAAADLAVQSRLARLSPAPGARYFQQKQVDAMIDGALRVWVKNVTQDIHAALAAHSAESTKLSIRSSTASARSEPPILNDSFLVSRSALPGFCAAVEGQKRAYSENGLTLEVRGPWPPYNFCPNLTGSGPDDR